VGPRVGLEDAENRKFLTLPELELRPLGHPAYSQSLYRLRYPGSSSIGMVSSNSDSDSLNETCCDLNFLLLNDFVASSL
jgi:hypothetical protein